MPNLTRTNPDTVEDLPRPFVTTTRPTHEPHPDVTRAADVLRDIMEWLSGIRLRVLLRRLLGQDRPAPAASPQPTRGTTPAPVLRPETWQERQRRLWEQK